MPLACAPASKVSTPSFTDQAAGAFLTLNPRQPLVDLPSNSSFQPAFFSSGVNVLGLGSAARASIGSSMDPTSEAARARERRDM